MPLYPRIPSPPVFNGAPGDANSLSFYTLLGDLIRDENPYGEQNIVCEDLTPAAPNNNTQANRNARVAGFLQAGVRIMGWLRNHWSENPYQSCDHRMGIDAKRQSYYWTTMYPEDPTASFPSIPDAAPVAGIVPNAIRFEPTAANPEVPFNPTTVNNPGAPELQNSADIELHQVCKTVYVPFEYDTQDGRRLKAAILIGYVGSGGGEP